MSARWCASCKGAVRWYNDHTIFFFFFIEMSQNNISIIIDSSTLRYSILTTGPPPPSGYIDQRCSRLVLWADQVEIFQQFHM